MLQEYRTKVQANPYHLVEPSPWPIITSFSLLAITVSIVLYFHGYCNISLVSLSLVSVILSMILWLRDVTAEGTNIGNHTFAVQKGLSLGFALFVVSEIMVFFSIFWAFFHSALAPTVELGVHWPPIGIDAMSPYEIPLLNTLLLLSSGATITYAHHALISKNRVGAIYGTILTVILAIIFTGLQGFEYWTATFTFSDSVYGSVFYAATGCHGLHVIVGTLIIVVSLARITKYHLTDHHHMGYETSILYYHFVDVVWLVLYAVVYWWGY